MGSRSSIAPGLILEIFSGPRRDPRGCASGRDGGALSYQRTRLVRAWTHLERQRGGLGFVGGPGETQIEADRRAIDDQLVRLRRQLDKVVKTREPAPRGARQGAVPDRGAGGLHQRRQIDAFQPPDRGGGDGQGHAFRHARPDHAADRTAGGGPEVILSDTVGFISDLPTELVAAFRATLEEVLAADLICMCATSRTPRPRTRRRCARRS